MEKRLKIIVEKHPDGYVAYPLGMKGVVVGQGRHVYGGARRREVGCRIPRSDIRRRDNNGRLARHRGIRCRRGRGYLMPRFPSDAHKRRAIKRELHTLLHLFRCTQAAYR